MYTINISYCSLSFTVQELLRKYKDQFRSDVDSHAILQRLKVEGVIPNKLAHQMDPERNCVEESTNMLFLHLREHSDVETLLQFCDILIKVGVDGYPRMRCFGQCFKDSISQHLQAAAPQYVRLDTPQDRPQYVRLDTPQDRPQDVLLDTPQDTPVTQPRHTPLGTARDSGLATIPQKAQDFTNGSPN